MNTPEPFKSPPSTEIKVIPAFVKKYLVIGQQGGRIWARLSTDSKDEALRVAAENNAHSKGSNAAGTRKNFYSVYTREDSKP